MSEQTEATAGYVLSIRPDQLPALNDCLYEGVANADEEDRSGIEAFRDDLRSQLRSSHRYKIVPADAVVVTPEIAATAAEACEEAANRAGEEYEANCYPVLTPGRKGWLAEHDRYRAAAAALRGERQ